MSRHISIGKDKSRNIGYTGFVMEVTITTANTTFTLPTRNGYTYNATVSWGDNSAVSNIISHNTNNTHTYTTKGKYLIEIKGQFDTIYFINTGSKLLVTKIVSWGGNDFLGFSDMSYSFYGCSNLKSIPNGPIKQRIGITNFSYCFGSCSGLTSIPTDLFKYNTAVTNFSYCFYVCNLIQTVPVDLFKYNTLATNFSNCFNSCNKLQINADIFGTDRPINFGTRVMNFNSCFYRTIFTGTKGDAPPLWDATMGATSTKTTCFGTTGGNNATSLNNYGSIPATWI